MQPLADAIRPQTLDEVAGQKHLLGQGAMLRRIIESGTSANLIFYGPSGTGKTTLASIIAASTGAAFAKLNAVTSGVKELREIIDAAAKPAATHVSSWANSPQLPE